MNAETWRALDRLFKKSPILRAATAPSREEVLKSLEQLGRPAHEDYVEFVERYGGATVGPLPIFGLRVSETMGKPWHVVEVNEGYRAQRWPGVDDWLVFSVDLAGNPIGLADDGTVWISDHDFGGVQEEASSFEDFIRRRCLRVDR